MTVSRRQVLAGTAVAISAPAIWTSARAQAAVTLKVHHFLPAQSPAQKSWMAPWAEKVEKEAGGKLKIELYPSMQLGGRPPQLFDQSRDGVADIVWTLAGYTPGRFPRLEVFELPFIASNLAARSSAAVWDYYEQHARDELKDVHVLAAFTHGKGNIFTKDRVIKSVDDIKGLKIRVPSRPINDTLQNIGAVPQGIPAPGVPEALAKGVVDGVMMPYEIVPALKLDELTNKVSEFAGDRSIYTAVFLFTMNKAKYESLPADVKKVIDDNSGAALSRDAGKKWDEFDLPGRAAIDKAKIPVTVIDGADLAAWKAQSQPVVKAWIEARTKAGENGAELVKAAETLIAKYST